MTVGFDPKITTGAHPRIEVGADGRIVTPDVRPATVEARPATPEVRPATVEVPTPQAMEKPKPVVSDPAAAPSVHPQQKVAATKPQPFESELSRLKQALRGARPERMLAAAQAFTLAMSYTSRRSRQARRQAIELCDEVSRQLAESMPTMVRHKAVLIAEGQVHELDSGATASACHSLILLIEESEPESPSDSVRKIMALSRAVLAHGLIQLAVHFPEALAAVDLEIPQALQQAFLLGEESVMLAPELPDGHAALARALLCQDQPDALIDAEMLAKRALDIDPDHDPAHAVLANLLLARGDVPGALAEADRLVRRGNGLPHALLLHAVVLAEAGRFDEARGDIDRALRMSPKAPVLYAEGARIARAAGHESAARDFETRALDAFDDDEVTKPDFQIG